MMAATSAPPVNGKKVKVLRGRRIQAVVTLTGLPRGRFTVDISVKTSAGKTIKGKRRYRTCVGKPPQDTVPPL